MSNTGVVFDISHFMIEDGPGIRTNVFMKGCPLRCQWCSNAYGLNKNIELSFNTAKCTGCGACIAVCQQDAISWNDSKRIAVQDFAKCINCMECVSVCKSKARTQIGIEMSITEVVKEILKDRAFYRRGDGGVTMSGGEILMQGEFVSEVLRQCQNEGINTAVETSAYGQWESFSKIIGYCDTVFIDCKAIDSDLHKKLTGVNNEVILENIQKAAKLCDKKDTNLIIRFPLIPAKNNNKENIIKTAEFVNDLAGDVLLNILPYHNYGGQKYEYLGETYLTEDIEPQSKEELAEVESLLNEVSNRYSIGGYNIDF